MKRKVLTLLIVLSAVVISAQAQFQRRTVEERVASVHAKIDSAFKPDAKKLADVDSAFASYYRAQDKLREEMMNGGDRQAMREKMQPLTEERDNKLKTILGDDNFKIWKEQIEPSMRPQRRNGGGGNQ